MTSPTTPESNGGPEGTKAKMVARDNAHVSAQIGVMLGNATFTMSGDSPEEKFRVGRNYLDGNVQKLAEKLIGEAFMGGLQTPEVAYYWALSVLSGRNFENLESEDFSRLSRVFRFTRRSSGDQWTRALAVVQRLLHSLAAEDSATKAGVETEDFAKALADFDRLQRKRREEIRRHLDPILTGGIQDRMDARYAAEVEAGRMSDERTSRVMKFFEPEPAPPLRRVPKPIDVGVGAWAMLTLGAILVAIGLGLLLPVLARQGAFRAAGVLGLCFCGGFLALQQWWKLRLLANRAEARRDERADIPDDEFVDDNMDEFTGEVKDLVEYEFNYFRPRASDEWKVWHAKVRGVKNALRRELVDIYSDRPNYPSDGWSAGMRGRPRTPGGPALC